MIENRMFIIIAHVRHVGIDKILQKAVHCFADSALYVDVLGVFHWDA